MVTYTAKQGESLEDFLKVRRAAQFAAGVRFLGGGQEGKGGGAARAARN